MNFYSALVAQLAASAESFAGRLRSVRLRSAVPAGKVFFRALTSSRDFHAIHPAE
jgi:hypothetical protein